MKPRASAVQHLADLPVAPGAEPMEARSEAELPRGAEWRYEPKFDGFRCLAHRQGPDVALMAKSGKPLARYFPEVQARLAAARAQRFVIDGELVIDGAGFEALQLRLHPAESRIRRLAAEAPATFVVFDLLVDATGKDLTAAPFDARRAALERLVGDLGAPEGLRLAPQTADPGQAARWLAVAGSGGCDGVVAKRGDAPYRFGERAMVKVKRVRTADCVVGGFRYLKERREVGSLLLGLYDEARRLNHVGFTSQIAERDRAQLTRELEAIAAPPGFTGAAPGGPSRWASERSAEWTPLAPKLVVEVGFDQVTGGRMRHGARFVRWRPDKSPGQCLMEQLQS